MYDRIKAAEDFRQNCHEKYSILGWIEGPAAEAADLRDVTTFLVDLMDDEVFACELMDLCLEVGIDFARAQVEAGAYTIGVGDAIASQVDQYLEGPYREDPFYETSMHQPRAKIYRLSRVTLGKLQQSDYYRTYYADTGTCDEAVYLSKLHGGNVINLSMMRLPQHGEFSEQEYESLYLLAEPVSELIKSHSEHDDFAVTHLIQPGIDHQIDLAFRTFGASLLSPREKDVLEMMLRGYGTDISADRLGIALETVRRHRKSIYRKLDVSSQTDLFSLFLNSMSCLGEAGGEDPLSIYMSPR